MVTELEEPALEPSESNISTPSPDAAACRLALHRICRSKNFEKALRLSTLLRHVCELALDGRGAELSEITIGVAVFSRSEDYNTADDNIVRSTMRLLRLRLERYYSEEGSAEAIRVEIPRGAYVPVFRFHPASPAPAEITVEPQPALGELPPASRTRRGSMLRFAGWVLLLLLVTITSFELGRSPRSFLQSPSDRFWGLVFPEDRATLIVPADTMLMLYERAAHRSVTLEQYVTGNFAPLTGTEDDPEEHGLVSNLRTRRYTAVTSVGIAASLGRVAASHRSPQVKFSRDVRLEDVKQSNVILIGAEQNNPWVHLFRQNLNFHLDWVGSDNRFRILNDRPRDGEPAEWNWSREDASHRGYGQIAFLPNLSGQGYVLIVAGTSMDGTQAAAEFLMDPKRMDPILREAEAKGKGASGFEILLLANVLDHGTLAATTLGTRFYSRP